MRVFKNVVVCLFVVLGLSSIELSAATANKKVHKSSEKNTTEQTQVAPHQATKEDATHKTTVTSSTKLQYSRKKIETARFGTSQEQAQMEKALGLDEQIDAVVFGQEAVAEAIKEKLAIYLDGFKTPRREPVAINLMGLPGLGKTAIIDVLSSLGVQVLKFDAQTYSQKGGSSSIDKSLSLDLQVNLSLIDPSKPTILVIEEIDKLPEIDQQSGAEITQKVIGTLNQILSEGAFTPSERWSTMQTINVSKMFVVTTMNLSPNEISNFSKEAVGIEKSFYDFTIEDFAKFHQWLTSESAAVPKVLSRLFRPNTVSRLMPISALVNPLTKVAYRKIVAKIAAAVLQKSSKGSGEDIRIEYEISDALIDYLNDITVYAPSGARASVAKTDQLVRQLILFSKRIPLNTKESGDQSSLSLPRKVKFDFDPTTSQVILDITSLKIVKNRQLVEDQNRRVNVNYSPATGLFSQPPEMVTSLAPIPVSNKPTQTPIYKKDIRTARFPAKGNAAKGLARFINQELFGQSRFSKLVESSMNQYMVRPEDAKLAPVSLVLAGFPGIGKSEMINLTGKYLDLPIIKVNLQQYTSNAPETASNLIRFISDEIMKLKNAGKNKYILLIEELDKVYEIDPVSGSPVDRPVMAIIKDLMNNGQTEVLALSNYSADRIAVDARGAFLAVTMNFAMDRFNFKADPRLTTIEDVTNAWRMLSTRLADLKQVLGSLFLPETVNRMISSIYILKPLVKEDYAKVIDRQIPILLNDRFSRKNEQNLGQIEIELSPAYKEFLFSESVVPSEGARFAAKMSRNLISLDLEGALKKIPKSSPLSARPIKIALDYDTNSRLVTASLSTNDSLPVEELKNAYSREVELNFPPLHTTGKVSKERLVTSLHEFGHALAAIRMGLPFESITVVPPQNSIGGYVKYRGSSSSADELIGRIFSALASRAMERVMLSHDPLSSSSVVDITAGASSDILQATKILFNVIFELGFDPQGGTIERMGIEGPVRYANFADLPHEKVEALSRILRDIENSMVKDFVNLHSREWYADKIYLLALRGGMTEHEFYELSEIPYAGPNWRRIDQESPLFELFPGKIKDSDLPKGFDWQPSFAAFKGLLLKSIERHLHPQSRKVESCRMALNH